MGQSLWGTSMGKHRHHPFRGFFASQFGQVVADQRAVVAVDGQRCIVQRRQQVLLDVFDLGCALMQAFEQEANVLGVQLEQLGFDHLGREVGPADAGGLAAGTDGFGHELDDLVD